MECGPGEIVFTSGGTESSNLATRVTVLPADRHGRVDRAVEVVAAAVPRLRGGPDRE